MVHPPACLGGGGGGGLIKKEVGLHRHWTDISGKYFLVSSLWKSVNKFGKVGRSFLAATAGLRKYCRAAMAGLGSIGICLIHIKTAQKKGLRVRAKTSDFAIYHVKHKKKVQWQKKC